MAYRRDVWTAADVLCPFYMSDDATQCTIRCEGFCDDNSLISRFRTLKARDGHMGSYCAGRFEDCPVYALVYGEKYDG